jgi:hypothetical protein
VAEKPNKFTRETSMLAARIKRLTFDILALDVEGLNSTTTKALGSLLGACEIACGLLTPKPKTKVLADVPPAKGSA